MEYFEKKFCRLCFEAINDENFKTMETIGDMLDIILLKQNLDNSTKYFMCNDCYEKACAAFKFKSTCLDTEAAIVPYVNCEDIIDLQEIYCKDKRKEQVVNVFNDNKICRLCMQLISGEYISFDEVEKYMFLMYMPELNFGATKDPVICKPCFDCLGTHSDFIKSCLDLEKKRKHFYDNVGGTSRLEESSIDLQIETKYIPVKCEESEQEGNEFLIKVEEVEIKSEDQDRLQPSQHVKLNKSCCDKRKINCKSILSVDNDSDIQCYNCNLCVHNSKYKTGVENHTLLHKNIALQSHMMTHKDPSETKWYKCDLCSYKSKQKNYIKTHMLTHKHSSEIQWFECNLCNYKSNVKKGLKSHMLTHKPSSEIQWYGCDFCDYKSRYKSALKNHTFTHKDPTEIQWYECGLCDYKGKQKIHLITHMMRHKDPSEIKWYKCDFCGLKSKKKSNLETHMLTHKHSSEIQWFECYLCNHKAKVKKDLKSHMLTHKHSSEIQWYGCDLCDYKSKYKSALKSHTFTHKDPTEIQWYECGLCDYKGKRKIHLTTHMKRHKDIQR